MSLRIDNGERATLEYADIALSPTRYIASWLRQRGWRLPEYRWRLQLSVVTAQLLWLHVLGLHATRCAPLCHSSIACRISVQPLA